MSKQTLGGLCADQYRQPRTSGGPCRSAGVLRVHSGLEDLGQRVQIYNCLCTLCTMYIHVCICIYLGIYVCRVLDILGT